MKHIKKALFLALIGAGFMAPVQAAVSKIKRVIGDRKSVV